MAASVEERRSSRRQPADVLLDTLARVRPGRDVVLIDIATGGALVESPARLLPGARVVLQLLRPGETISLGSRVVRCEVAGIDPTHGIRYRGALCFDQPLGFVTE